MVGQGGRRGHHSVDVPGDIAVCETVLAAESVVGLDDTIREIDSSGVSEGCKKVVNRVLGAHIEYWLEKVDEGILNV